MGNLFYVIIALIVITTILIVNRLTKDGQHLNYFSGYGISFLLSLLVTCIFISIINGGRIGQVIGYSLGVCFPINFITYSILYYRINRK